MAKLWLTYAWDDNKQRDVDFAAQELSKAGLEVKLDRWTLRAGVRLWDQIEKFIQGTAECDAWAMYATQNSLGSEACKEEYTYALDRALHARGSTFPIIGIFPSSVDRSLIPAGIRTRLYVSLRDDDWKERIVAAAEGRAPAVERPAVEPFAWRVLSHKGGRMLELRPRAGSWFPFFVGVPEAEQAVLGDVRPGPAGVGPITAGVISSGATIEQGKFVRVLQSEITPTQSAYVAFNGSPSIVHFGQARNRPQYWAEFDALR